jgi:predicted nucleotidyltransferase
MHNNTLLTSTGDPHIDQILRGVIGLVELLFPERVRSYYITGSYADGTAVPTSDLDVMIVLKDSATRDELDKIFGIADQISLLSPMFLDLEGIGEDQLLSKGYFLKFASLLLYGDDIRDAIQTPDMDDYVRSCMHNSPIYFMTDVARRQPVVTYPLDYPDRMAEFYGYDYNPLEDHQDTKVLMAIIGHAATAIVALKSRQFVGTKSQCLSMYKEHVHDEWTDLLTEVYTVCRNTWSYRIPENAEDRRRLRRVCSRTLKFENHFLKLYRSYLLTELYSSDDRNKLKAIEMLGKVIYPDKMVLSTLRTIEISTTGELKTAAVSTIRKIEAKQKQAQL